MEENPYKAPADFSPAEHAGPDDRPDLIEWAAAWLTPLGIMAMALVMSWLAIKGCLP